MSINRNRHTPEHYKIDKDGMQNVPEVFDKGNQEMNRRAKAEADKKREKEKMDALCRLAPDPDDENKQKTTTKN